MFVQSFLLTNFTIVLSFSLSRWQAWMSRSSIFTTISSKIFRTLPTKSWSLIDKGIPITSTVFWREYWALAQHCLSVYTTLSVSFEFTFVVTAKFASRFLKYPSRSLTSVVRFVTCEAKLASVCSTSCSSSNLLSVLKTASVWVVART